MNERSDKALRRQNMFFAVLLFVVSACLPLVDRPSLWPIAALTGGVGGLLLWGAFSDESIASPVIALVVGALPAMFTGDGVALGSLTSVAIALVLGEHLATAQSARYSTPGNEPWSTDAEALLLHGGAAVAAMVVALVATLLPEVRWWSLAAGVALAIMAVALRRRRSALPEALLPPPAPPVSRS